MNTIGILQDAYCPVNPVTQRNQVDNRDSAQWANLAVSVGATDDGAPSARAHSRKGLVCDRDGRVSVDRSSASWRWLLATEWPQVVGGEERVLSQFEQ